MNVLSHASVYLMCPPNFFGVDYVINPWMEGNEGRVEVEIAQEQWRGLFSLLLRLGASVEQIQAQPGLPDMVFTANFGQILGRHCIPARLRPVERRGEESFFRAWFRDNVFSLSETPEGVFFEGAGDALFGEAEDGSALLWCAHGFRSDRAAHRFLAETFGITTVLLRLMDARYYHLDTCFCPLPGGYLLWFPEAFDRYSLQEITRRIPESKRYEVTPAEAADFTCNAVAVDRQAVVLNRASDRLKRWLTLHGFVACETPLTQFMKSGGSAKCLTLRLNESIKDTVQ
jgi:N-dimethylarginine dimethylaminohydrolase